MTAPIDLDKVWCFGRRFYIRPAQTTCIFCEQEVTWQEVVTEGEVIWTRVGGDSANGYEPYHTTCLPTEAE